MGKFTQSVRRIVQDVKDEGTMSREEVVDTNERLRMFRYKHFLISNISKKQQINWKQSSTSEKEISRLFLYILFKHIFFPLEISHVHLFYIGK